MADTLTQLISKVQAQLLDSGTLFTTPTCTAAIRQALAAVNVAIPQNAAINIDAIAGKKEYELTLVDPSALRIFAVLLTGTNDDDTDLPFYAYNEDSRIFFRLRSPVAAGQVIIVHYSIPHTIFGLDGSIDSTFTDEINTAAINGACYYACMIRAAAMIETNNVQPRVAASYLQSAGIWLEMFNKSLAALKHQPTYHVPPFGQWNDEYHSQEYPL